MITTESRPAIAYVATGELMADGRPHGVVYHEQTTRRTVNIWFYADGSAKLNVFPSDDTTASVSVEIAAPLGA